MPQTTYQRIAKNAVMLYLRMIIFVVVSLYTSRIALQVLGVDDYGVYSVVGGIILMLGFLNTSLSGSTSRFLIYEMKRSTLERLRQTFASAFIIHLGLAVFILIVAETIGLYFISHQLVIPTDRMEAALWVYQLSLFSALIAIIQAPYNACMIAHERMNIYAYFELLNVFLKLGAIFLLQIVQTDKLILYVLLLTSINFISCFIYWAYCRCHFSESNFRFVWRSDLLRPMLSFSTWSLLHAASTTGVTQGGNMLLNMFFGTALNAAFAITTTIQGILTGFIHNIITAFRPQIIQKCALKEEENMVRLMVLATTLSIAMFLLLAFPLFTEAEYILHLWLGKVPNFTSHFLRISLVTSLITAISYILFIAIEGKGAIRTIRLYGTLINCVSFPAIYIAFLCGGSAHYLYIILLIASGLTYIVSLWLFRCNFPRVSLSSYVTLTIRPHILPALLATGCLLLPRLFLEECFLRLVLVCLLSTGIYALSFYIWSISVQDQQVIKNWMRQHIKLTQQSKSQ